MKVAIISDLHENLSALNAFLKDIESENIEKIYCLGDSIAMGAFPSECMEILFNDSRFISVMGNHEEYYTLGIPNPKPIYMSEVELKHQEWVHLQLGEAFKKQIALFPYLIELELNGKKILFMHYVRDSISNDFRQISQNTVEDLDKLFDEFEADIVFFGHSHIQCDILGKCRYINPGSIGCSKDSIARYTIMENHGDKILIQSREIEYDKKPLFYALEDRNVPEREFIGKIFFGFGEEL